MCLLKLCTILRSLIDICVIHALCMSKKVCCFRTHFHSYFQAGKGVLRSMIGDVNAVSDIIPVDISVNMMVCIGWYTGTKRQVIERMCEARSYRFYDKQL